MIEVSGIGMGSKPDGMMSPVSLESDVSESDKDERMHASRQPEISVEYQPVASLRTGLVTGFDAVPRWHRPSAGLSAADRETAPPFPLLVAEVCAQLERWNAQGNKPAFVSLALPLQQDSRSDGVGLLGEAVRQHRLSSSQITLEISAQFLSTDTARLGAELKLLRKTGYRVALANFGPGHASISKLMELPLTGVKFGTSFTATLADSATSRAILTSVTHLARDLGLSVTVAGIDRQREFDVLRDYLDLYWQGALLCPPLPAEALAKRLESSFSQRFRSQCAGVDK
ncbi:EAL domain-containing protein [Burkholderia pseudomultivorans]|uniref:EAL domain-containing protein n=1 Tax=Burkholderia pseudomultivorans TaxID=1207504 RepID=UPI0001FDA850|nr:EAL domain-containing protein [Burkholderia pseudomultivorans]EGD01651.1 EAL domain-containing protein [Burkholderia sp. TJI49]KVC40112.1 hypothetical protein WS58_19150 [Burkholderia pseudomultivorans]MDS0793933.1 EAL domain-containing protein [Burkholderia pseudomultivorans]